ncbi:MULTISPECIES: tRNA (cytidine(34)-2'-O)-methyltransferase [unclassified Synechococcus]|jgi:tRNA (cytidine/uridine-2'-O-)-methyltransferase|uniref:tRNA (cytidine(34)-2'-O)-methyltransferase n=1 Tax=unclassified Synechococcus TaxID=2626047 RepID=UPI000B994760|nr:MULTISPECIES: tRNA (cytidine(34)-2'-O)-methyltransferase [unclassified Synechococcus]MCP9828866.1 tRNA (cytidine(34)-2'-O)-methyltransferase [Synechococcus sp. L2F]MCP9845383.1 tRNA (cytidine(34)-2'-O)-methyltransferase [Synechococcus sp. Lug-A]MCT0211228.1 tRNA (cytidine(34)-2'-O)-methyltransferase [Synechococcus sp. CS-1333]PZV22089.1 MAG: tRNA (cytidine(34)-2'-O)-methyltransferase [Cyanobium sp.]
MPRVVLFEPEIPPNTGNVARTCAATGCELHLIEPLGFQIDDRQLKRAGLDYWPWVQLHRHANLVSFEQHRRRCGGRLVAFSSQVDQPYTSFAFRDDDWLLHGRESSGLPPDVLAAADARLTVPMPGSVRSGGGVRSLNLSVAAAVVLFEAIRQLGTGISSTARDA